MRRSSPLAPPGLPEADAQFEWAADVGSLGMRPAIRGLGRGPVELAGTDRVPRPFIRKVVDEERRVPSAALQAEPQVADGIAAVDELRVRVVERRRRFERVERIVLVGPLCADVPVVRAEPVSGMWYSAQADAFISGTSGRRSPSTRSISPSPFRSALVSVSASIYSALKPSTQFSFGDSRPRRSSP